LVRRQNRRKNNPAMMNPIVTMPWKKTIMARNP
jgi:hypothetical protein